MAINGYIKRDPDGNNVSYHFAGTTNHNVWIFTTNQPLTKMVSGARLVPPAQSARCFGSNGVVGHHGRKNREECGPRANCAYFAAMNDCAYFAAMNGIERMAMNGARGCNSTQ